MGVPDVTFRDAVLPYFLGQGWGQCPSYGPGCDPSGRNVHHGGRNIVDSCLKFGQIPSSTRRLFLGTRGEGTLVWPAL
jgi:hypothetical protein